MDPREKHYGHWLTGEAQSTPIRRVYQSGINGVVYYHYSNIGLCTFICRILSRLLPGLNFNQSRTKYVANMAIVFLFIVIFFTSMVASQGSRDAAMSRPAEYLGKLATPGKSNQIVRPSAIYIDKNFDEVFVCDPGHNRIVIFDLDGNFRFEFSGGSYFSTPVSVAVDTKGFVWVLGSTRLGRQLFVFDFDGVYVRNFPIEVAGESEDTQIGNFVLDAADNIYLLDHASARIISFEPSGTFRYAFEVFDDRDKIEKWELVLGALSIDHDRLFIPSGRLGVVKIYDLKGNQLASLGRKGNQIGQLNFPVAVAVSRDGIIMVLDKHRFNVVCFSPERQFIGEFGGKGISPGWFYHPTLLAVDDQNRAIIGQIFNNKIQLCRIPDFIIAEIGLVTPIQSDSIGIIETERIHKEKSTIRKEDAGAHIDFQPAPILIGRGDKLFNRGLNALEVDDA